MAVNFDIDFTALSRLSEAIQRLPNKADQVIDKTLKKQGSKQIAEHITSLMHVSRERNGSGTRNKVHAKHVQWHGIEQKEHLSVTVKTKGGAANKKGSFGYLVFPNEGRGKFNNRALEFMEIGRDKAIPGVIEIVETELIKTIQEEI
ncbi:hypothetical protein [Bacillus sp. Hm123]|uniref:hypothetical protein n=1 Tax=Bacillus sp. Hm123 TaxID=3450745 RepID=UPI003F43E557